MEDPGKLSIEERYRRAIEALMRFDYGQREGDLQWMLAESRKPIRGLSWLKEKYYELIQKCTEHPVPFELIYDLETIASRIFPRAARKSAFLRDPIKEYFRTRLKQYDPQIKQLIQKGNLQIADLFPLLADMARQDGRSMVVMFLLQLKEGKVHKSLAGLGDAESLQRISTAVSQMPLSEITDDGLMQAMVRADAGAAAADAEDETSLYTEDLTDFAPTLQDSGAANAFDSSAPVILADHRQAGENVHVGDPFDTAGAPEESNMESVTGPAETVDAASAVDAAVTADFADTTDATDATDVLTLGALESEESLAPQGAPESFESPGPSGAFSGSGASQQGSGVGFYSGNYGSEPLNDTSGGQKPRNLRSDEAYKAFLIQQSERVTIEKDRIYEVSGLSDQVDRALEQRDEEESVHLLAELHPLCFLSAQEKLLRGIDALQSPLGKIMGHLSEMYRKLNVPDMRAYVDYYTAQLDAAGLFDTFPAIRERLTNYRNSLVDPPPELLKQVHIGLRQIEEKSQPDHRACVQKQVDFLHACLANEVFGRVWPTIAVILENLVHAELQSLGERQAAPVWRDRLQAEDRTEPRALPDILADVEPASAQSIAGILAAEHSSSPAASGFAASQTQDPEEGARIMETELAALFSRDSQAGLERAGAILDAPAHSLIEKEAVISVLGRQSLASAAELSHFHQLVSYSGTLDEQRTCAESFRGSVTGRTIDSKISGIELQRAQNHSIGMFHEFLMSKDRLQQSRLFTEIQKSPHIPEAMKTLFRQGSDAGIVEKAMEGITTSNLSNINKLKLLRILKKLAVHRNWLTTLTEERLDRKIQFYERILAADQKRAVELAARKAFYTSRRAEIRQALLERKAKFISTETGQSQASKPGEEHRPGFSDEFLEGLIHNRMRAARWYGKLPEHSREDLHRQAAVPGKAQILVNQITKDNAFKKALRRLQPPVDQKVLAEVSAMFPEPEYQTSLEKFRKPVATPPIVSTDAPSAAAPAASSARAIQSTPSAPSTPFLTSTTSKTSTASPASVAADFRPDASFDRLLDNALLGGPDLPEIPALPLLPVQPHSHSHSHSHSDAHAAGHAQKEHGEAAVQETAQHSNVRAGAAHSPAPAHPSVRPGEESHKTSDRHARHGHEHQKPAAGGVEGVAASLAKGFSSLFGKSAPARSSETKPAAASGSGKTKERASGAKKTKQAAATLMKAVAGYAKGEVFLTEKDLKSLEKDMDKHPDSRKLMDDHAYLFKLDHPDAAQFQPPIFIVIPTLKACNHDAAKKKLEMGKIEKAIASAPAKKKPHLQALLTFMERYKTK